MDLHYRTYGSGPPLVILHGMLGAGGNWATLSRKVFGRFFTVYAVDQRGHGRSPHADVIDYPSLAADLHGFLDARGLEQAHILGHSMGGKAAMQFALAHPERVGRLVVVDIGPGAYAERHTEILEAMQSVSPVEHRTRSDIDEALAAHIPSMPIRQLLMKNLERDASGHLHWRIDLPTVQSSYPHIAGAIEAMGVFERPVLFVRGAQSTYLGEDDLPLIRAYFPRAEMETIEDAGHWVHADQPVAFARAVQRFLVAPKV